GADAAHVACQIVPAFFAAGPVVIDDFAPPVQAGGRDASDDVRNEQPDKKKNAESERLMAGIRAPWGKRLQTGKRRRDCGAKGHQENHGREADMQPGGPVAADPYALDDGPESASAPVVAPEPEPKNGKEREGDPERKVDPVNAWRISAC